MAQKNWVKMTTATTGTGTITLGTALAGHVAFGDQYADGDEMFYTIIDGNNKEVGIGTYTASGTTLSRSTILETLVSGVFDNTTPTAITLSGNAIVTVTNDYYGNTTHAPIWKDNIIPFISTKTGSSPPGFATIRDGLMGYAFDDTADEEVYIYFHIDHDYIPGSKFYTHIHWTPGNNTNTGNVRWGIEYSMAARDTGAFPASATIYLTQAGSGTAYKHQVVEDATGITLPTPEVDSVVIMRVFRNATGADTFIGDAYGLFIDLHYQADKVGTPAKASDFYTW